MSAFIRYLPAAALLLPWLIDLATWLVARSLNMPVPLVQAASFVVFLRVQAFENSIGRSLCPIRLWRRLRAFLRSQRSADAWRMIRAAGPR
jgi:hypothetical protein